MLKLGVNIDHVATLREARYRGRGGGEPDPIAAARVCVEAGAHGITAHLREDRRHIVDRDVEALRATLKVRFNLELANVPSIVEFALRVKPDVVCLVPERREEVTTEGGLDVQAHMETLQRTIRRFNEGGIDVSLFIAPELKQIEASSRVGTQIIELHTGAFAEAFHVLENRESELGRLVAGARLAKSLGLRVNAGHGLNYENLPELHRVPYLEELNIGHSVISRAVFEGLGRSVKEMLALMQGYVGESGASS